MKTVYMHIKNNTPVHILAHEDMIQFGSDNGINVGDAYHTMDELYDHRMALNIALFNLMGSHPQYIHMWTVYKSKLHADGTMFEGGYFIVIARHFIGTQISYHYKLEHWDKFKIPKVERIPWEYDGHTPKDCIERLINL